PEPVDGDDEPTVVFDLAQPSRIAVAVETADGGTLWDPVPVTLPTYVSKPRAPRTIRTIDLGQPVVARTDRTARAADAPAPATPDLAEPREAVNG
ncbi:MAG: hypothetical protein M3P83_06915, partial [Actinomycetota bacterium]|nr:hypothetical protein [Actinomycetota bacterium]